MKRQFVFSIGIISALAVLFISCSDLKTDLPTASKNDGKIHDASWNDTASLGFHGRVVKQTGYNLAQCGVCHSKQYTGGTSGVKCYTCHSTYPHGSRWANASDTTYHGKHLLNQAFDATECKSCHGTALTGGTSGKSCFLCHAQYPHASGWENPSNAASHGKYLKTQNWVTTSCVACHGSDLKGGISTKSCLTCHPQYPHPTSYTTGHPAALRTAGYPLTQCQSCHGSAYNGGSVVDATVSCEQAGCHRDGSGNLKSPEACNTCHGTFTARADSVAGWAPAAGAHQKHLTTTFGKQVKCAECHKVPAAIGDAGHFGSDLKAEVAFNDTLARLGTAYGSISPVYNSTSATCASTYCHGNWKLRKASSSSQFVYTDTVMVGNNFSPRWIGGSTEAACGSCHGLPPTGHSAQAISACGNCHTGIANSSGQIIDKAKHINGKIILFGTERPM